MIITAIAPFVAALVYGGWAAYSNLMFGLSAAIPAALVQGGFAFSSTWLLNRTVQWLVDKHVKKGFSPAHVRLIVFAECSLLLLVIPLVLHLMVGTPNIFMAMLPGLVVGNLYLIYMLHLFTKAKS